MGGADAPLRPRPDRRRRRGPERLARPRLRPRGGEDRARRPPAREAGGLCRELGATAHRCDAAEPADVAALFRELDEAGRTPAAVVYNPSRRARGPLVELDPEEVRQDAAGHAPTAASSSPSRRRAAMLPRRDGAILFTGASASVKGYAALGPVRDGQVRAARPRPEHGARAAAAGHPRRPFRHRRRHPQSAAAPSPPTGPTACSTPTRSPPTYLDVLRQPRSAWTWEVELRPWVETLLTSSRAWPLRV